MRSPARIAPLLLDTVSTRCCLNAYTVMITLTCVCFNHNTAEPDYSENNIGTVGLF